MASLENLQLIILDADGVLKDSSRALDETYRRAFESKGMPYPYCVEDTWHIRGISKFNQRAEVLRALLVLSARNESSLLHAILERPDAELILSRLINETKIEKLDETIKDMVKIYNTFFMKSEEAKSFVVDCPYARESILSLKKKGYLLAILTNASKTSVSRDISYSSIFDQIVSEEDEVKPKPSREGIDLILKRLGVKPSSAIYVGDSGSDMQTAKNAECRSIAVLTGMGTMAQLSGEKPDFIFKNLSELDRLLPNVNKSRIKKKKC